MLVPSFNMACTTFEKENPKKPKEDDFIALRFV
jgi:hypothetical protein